MNLRITAIELVIGGIIAGMATPSMVAQNDERGSVASSVHASVPELQKTIDLSDLGSSSVVRK